MVQLKIRIQLTFCLVLSTTSNQALAISLTFRECRVGTRIFISRGLNNEIIEKYDFCSGYDGVI